MDRTGDEERWDSDGLANEREELLRSRRLKVPTKRLAGLR